MAYSIRLPDGTLVRNIPDELSPEEAKERIIKAYPEYAPDSGVLRQAADIPVQVGRGAVMGVRMLADTLGADNPISNALRGAEDYLGDLLSAEAKRDQKEIARILKDAEDKGVLDQVKAGLQALTVAPVDLVSQVLGTAAPTIAAGMAGAAAKLGVGGIRALQAGTGTAMGAGLAKGNIYDVVKEELMAAKVPEDIAEERAKAAQAYTGENWDQIILGGALGGAAALGPLERIFARVPAISPQVAAKNIFARAGAAGVAEAVPEAAQAFQEQVAQNIALQREGFDVPTFRGAVANATLEGLAGFGIGAPIGALEGKPTAQQPPGQQQTEPTPPAGAAPAEGIPLPAEEQLTAEEEAELQARIAATQLPPPPAAPVVVAPQPQPPLPPAPAAVEPPIGPMPEVEEEQIIVPPTTEEVTQGLPATPQTKSLTDQLAQVRAARMDPMLTPEDPAFLELDRREQEILGQIEQITAGVQIGQVPPTEPGVQIGQVTPPQAPKGAADNFLDAVVTQFGMDRGEAQKALDTLVQEELIELDPNSGQFRMKDGRYWDAEVMRKAAAMQTAAPPLQLPQPPVPPPITPETPVTPTGQTVEDQIRAQKAEERRERQAAQEAKKGEFVLQNRDRSGTASLEQMESIANAPDYGRAGFSRTPDGAPIIAYGDFAPEQLGREDVVTSARGRKIPVQYAVVEADEVITSNDMRGTPDTRYGDKEIPGPRAIAGNGRITGLRESFNRGTATPYVEEMAGDSSLHGISPDVIAGMEKPILVRVMPQEGLTRDIGDELNMSSMLELSPVEQARNDLNRVDLETLEFSEDGEVTNASLGQFINAQPIEERAKLVDKGLPTKQARQRLENAIFAQAYNDDDLIAMFAQTDDPEAKLVVNALAQVAPQMAQLEEAGDLDIRDIVTDAAKIIVSGKRRGLKMREIATQVDMTVDPDTRIIVELFAANPRSNKGAIEALRNAATTAYNESLRPEEGLFGVEPKMERREIVEQMRRVYEPTRTEDVAAAQRPGPAPSDVERQAEPSPAAVPPADQGFELTGQTPEELAELQRREESGEAEAERERLEAEEAARAAAEAERKIAEQKGVQPGDLVPTTGRMELSAAPITDLFGTKGITEQPTRGSRRVAAELSPIEAEIEESVAKEVMGTPQEALDDLVKFLRLESPDTNVTYDPNEKTIVTEEIYSGETTIKRIQFDAVASLAKKTDGPRGARYSILLKDTPTEAVVLTFEPEGIKPLDRTVGIKYSLNESKKDVNVPPVEEEIANRMKQLGVDNLEKRSKEVQDFYGVSKPVADAYVRAVRKQAEAIAKISYGLAPSSDFQEAYDEAQKLLNRIKGISKRKETKVEKKDEKSEIEAQRSTLERLLPKTAGDWVLEKITPYAGNWRVSYTTTNASGMVSGSSMPVEATELVGKTDAEIKSALSERARKNGLKGVADALEKPSTKKTRGVAEGTVVERIELPENLEIRIVKLKDGYSVYQYDVDADQIVMGEQRQFRAPAFPKDQDAYRAAEEFASDMFDKAVPKQPEKMKAAMQERLSRGEDVVNNRTVDPEIPANQRLVLMSCCATKNKAMGMGPAMDVYTGVFFQTFKNKVKEGAMPNVRILSAKYGFIKPDQRIGIYDQVMDKATADKFMVDDKLVEGFPSNIKDVLIVGSDQYQRVMKAAVEDLIKAGKIDKDASINVTKGGIGEQRAQLGKYLSSLPSTEGKAAKTPREFYMEMIPAAGFKRLEPNDPRRYKNKAGEEFLTFERDGVRIAVKGNTILFAADRGVGMYMGEGTDLLLQAMIVDEGARQQGRATKAMQDILEMADQAGMTTYIEPVQITKDVGMTTDQLKAFYKRFGFEPQKAADWTEPKQPPTDRVMVRQPGAKIEVATKAEPAKFGPTITEIMAETEELRKKAAEMGIETTYVPKPDTSKREAREKKEREDIQRLASERIRLEKLTKEPIKGTPEQRSAAERLARSVNGELLFLDGSRGLGIVFGKDRNGEDAYLPIYEGKISRVDVRDFTGLKTTDKEYLKQVRSELMREAGARQKRKDEEAGWEFMLKGTDDQQKGVRAVAKTLGGTPVYFDPETNVGLVRGYGELAGTPIYAMTMGDRYNTADVEESTVSLFAPYKAQLIEVKKRLEKEAEQKHKDDPFITFKDGIAMSADIDKATGEIFKEWKSMLGLGNVNIYLSTLEDAKENLDNFTGPHRVIGSGLLESLTGGRMRGMPDGSYFILFKKSTSKTAVLEMLAHELGHVHEREAYRTAPQELKNKLLQAHAEWLKGRTDKTSREAVEMLRAKTTAQTTKIGADIKTVRDLDRADPRRYWSSFSEWYADQVSRWAVTDEKPVGVVEKFFARLGAALRRFYQTLKGKKFLPNETFVQYLNQVKPTIAEEIPGPIKQPVQVEMTFDMQKELFGSTTEAKEISQAMTEVKGKKLPPGRSPELTAAAQAVKAGTMTAEEYNKLVDIYKPIPLYAEPLKPATSDQVFDALDVKKREQINPEIPNGTKVGLRLDIPAFNRKGVFVVSIHQKRTASAPGKVIGYGSVAKAKNVTFGVGNQLKALEIAAGSAKDALQTMEGEYVNTTPEQAFAEAQRAIKDPNYVQIGIDPTRHAYFYDRRTTLPVVAAEEVIQIGNMILAKRPTFGFKADFLYNIDGGPIAGDTQPDGMSFLDRLRQEESAKREVMRKETIGYYASIRQKQASLLKQVAKYGSTLDIQRQLTNLSEIAKTLKENIDLDRRPTYTAENFMRQARAALDGVAPYKEQAIDPEVFAVIQAVYMDDPKLLEGLRLSIKPEFNASDTELRKAFGIRASAGAFEATRRIVHLYTGTRGVTDPITIRHELTHSLEQMMTPAQRQAILGSYIDALKAAVKKHKDVKSQNFFDNVMRFLEKPSTENKQAVNETLPSYEFYQFVNPSEYWAVNAEKLMASRLGGSWDRFKKAMRKIFDKLKKIFGFDNRFAVHDVFDQVMSGSKKRLTRDSLASYALESGEDFAFLQNVEEDSELVRRYQRPDTPMLDHSPVRRMMVNAVSFAKDEFKNMAENPSDALRMMFNSLNRGVMYLRNKNIWFGSGINEADRIRYNGQVRTAEGLATASLALDNMLRGGNIATQALFLGGVEFNDKTLQYTAVRKEKNMTKVYEAEARLKEKLGEQLGTNIIQGYLEAKRSRSIKDEVEVREMRVELLNEEINELVQSLQVMDADPKTTKEAKDWTDRELRKLFKEYRNEKKSFEDMKKLAEEKVTMSDMEIDDFISREEAHPELREIIENFNAVNQNLLKFWREVGLLSEARYSALASIKDYVPWYRIMNDEEDVHSPLQATTRSATNIGREKLFKSGKPSVINDFIVEENQDVFRIQPSRVNAVKLNGVKLKPDAYEALPNGEVRLKVDYKPGDVVVIETQREIENMIDNMTRNVMRMTMNGLRQYAASRIVSEYATRDKKGQIMIFPKVDREKGRFDYIHDGRRYVVEIQDPLLAEAAYGMETVGMEMWKPLAAAANFTRRTITLSPVFQLKQVFKDAPSAALVTGVKNPAALIGGVYKGFVDAVRDSDPAAGILREAGIGGFYSPARTPEADVKRQIGIINNNTYDYVIKSLDHWGDSSDMAQRIAIYNRVLKETGDEALAMYQASNVINFLRHGSGQLSQALVKTVPFLNAYAQSIDVLYNALVGGGLRGKDRTAALKQLAITGSLLAGTAILYTMLVGDDEDYQKLDDQTKVRNIIIPGTDVILPMNTSAAFFFKAIPELITNKIINEGTKNEVDAARLRTALKESAIDLLLGPTPIPSAVKPVIEISLDYNFFTSRPITPRGMENLDAYQQYDMRTSEAAKLLSGLTGTEANRLLNPMEADHLIRSIFGTAGAMVAWSSNVIGEGSAYRPEMTIKEMPVVGAFLRPEIPRGREDLFYRLKDATDRKYRTFQRIVERGNMAEADAYMKRYPNLIAFYDYTTDMANDLKDINAAIRYIGEVKDPSFTPERKRREIQQLMELKQNALEGIEQFRKEAYAD